MDGKSLGLMINKHGLKCKKIAGSGGYIKLEVNLDRTVFIHDLFYTSPELVQYPLLFKQRYSTYPFDMSGLTYSYYPGWGEVGRKGGYSQVVRVGDTLQISGQGLCRLKISCSITDVVRRLEPKRERFQPRIS